MVGWQEEYKTLVEEGICSVLWQYFDEKDELQAMKQERMIDLP